MISLFFVLTFSSSTLTGGLTDANPHLDTADAAAQVEAARAVATDVFTDEFLLGLAGVESSYRPNATSRLIKGEEKRRTGVWNSIKRPPGAVGNFFCGVTQVTASTWARCLELRDVTVAYRVAVEELTNWYNAKPCRRLKGDARMRCTLLGYGGGWAAIKRNVSTYPTRVVRRALLIHRHAEKIDRGTV